MVQRAVNSRFLCRARQRGFTLVELLVVIAIIAILIGLAVVIASHVAGSGKQRQTEQTIRLLDAVLASYTNVKGGIPPPTVLDPRPQPASGLKTIIPIVDGRNCTTDPVYGEYINSVGLFMLQCKEVAEADAMLKGVDAKIIHEYDPDATDTNPNSPDFSHQPTLVTAFDGWGHPIRYVHPSFKGVVVQNASQAGAVPPLPSVETTVDQVLGAAPPGKQYGIKKIRRANSLFKPSPLPNSTDDGPCDSDGGIPIGNSPYFYSCGADGDPGTTEDNIYTVRPKFPKN